MFGYISCGRARLKTEIFKQFMLVTNNYCNMHCEHCICGVPINPQSSLIHRRQSHELCPIEVELFCEKFKGIGESEVVYLTGGEPTTMSAQKLYRIIDILCSYNRRNLWVLTNGFNILGLDKEHLNKISQIKMSDHGINHQHILDCVKYLKSFFKGTIKVFPRRHHYDLKRVRSYSANKARSCNALITLAFYRYVVYPCSVLPYVEMLNNNTEITDELIKAGWTLHNPNLIPILKNWRKTIPSYVLGQCRNNCWKCDSSKYRNKKDAVKITLKPNDVIKCENLPFP